jgi:hypothetical protein
MDKSIVKLKLLTTEGEVVDAILYCHQETTTIAGVTYYLLKKDTPADASGTTLSASTASVARVVWGKFVLSLSDVAKILSATIYATYRAYTGGGTVNAEIDILIRKADGTVRTTIATGVSKSANLGTSWATYTGASYSFVEYTVVDQSDYLEIDYIANVTVKKAGQYAYLRIDDNTLALADQTRSQDWGFQIMKTVTDNIYTSDNILSDKSISVSDSIGLADASLKNWMPTVIDSVTLSESLFSNKSLLISENISLSDAVEVLLGAIVKIVTDSIGLSDQVFRNKAVVVQDLLNLLDTLLRDKEIQLTDAIGLTELATIAKTLRLIDSVNLTDSVIRNKYLTLSDQLTLTDMVFRNRLLQVLDQLNLQEMVSTNKTLSVGDIINLIDQIIVSIRRGGFPFNISLLDFKHLSIIDFTFKQIIIEKSPFKQIQVDELPFNQIKLMYGDLKQITIEVVDR